jgi:hypothetical protein
MSACRRNGRSRVGRRGAWARRSSVLAELRDGLRQPAGRPASRVVSLERWWASWREWVYPLADTPAPAFLGALGGADVAMSEPRLLSSESGRHDHSRSLSSTERLTAPISSILNGRRRDGDELVRPGAVTGFHPRYVVIVDGPGHALSTFDGARWQASLPPHQASSSLPSRRSPE